MQDYVKTMKYEDWVGVWFYNENDKPFSIGEKMSQINESAYMNGYNWDAFFNYYLEKHAPDLLEGLESDPEAGSYVAYYQMSEENERKAERFVELIVSLIENEEEIYQIVRDNGDDIEFE